MRIYHESGVGIENGPGDHHLPSQGLPSDDKW